MNKTNPFRRHFKTIIIGFSVMAMVITAAFIIPGSAIPAFAASDAQAVQGTAQAPADHPALTKAFQAEQAFLSRQATHLDNTATIVTKIQNLITQAKSRNLDTGVLESALTAFQNRVSSARAAHDTASGILSTHAGFNADGSVTNAAEARQTVLDARQSLHSAATILAQAVRDLHAAVRAWRNIVKDNLQSAALEKAFAAEQNRLGIQQANLDKTGAVVTRVQALIDSAKAQNLDTSALESALATFNAQAANARSAHATAASILSTHAGFNPNGKVTNLTAARQTVLDARQSLKSAADILVQASRDLNQAVKAWRDAHPTATPAPTETNPA